MSPRPTVAFVRSLRAIGWGGYKAALRRAGVIKAGEDVPADYRAAFCNAYGRAYPFR
jgi:hypothetical protein